MGSLKMLASSLHNVRPWFSVMAAAVLTVLCLYLTSHGNPVCHWFVEVFGVVVFFALLKEQRVSLRSTAERYRSILATAMDGFGILDIEGRFLEVNDAFCQMIGYTRAELLTMTVSQLEANESPQQNAQHIQRVIVQGGDRFVSRHRTKAGGTIDLEIAVHYLASQACIVMFLRDITEQRGNHEFLRTERNRLLAVMDAMQHGVYIVDREGNVEYTNPTVVGEFGVAAGRKCYEYFHGRTERCSWCPDRKVFAGSHAQWELTFPSNNRTYEVCSAPLTNADGSISMLGMLQDVTARHQNEQMIRDSEERYRSLVENLDRGVTVIDATHSILMVNRAMAQYFGKTPAELVGKKCYREYEKRDTVCPHCPGVKALATGRPAEVETEGRRDDGTVFCARIAASPLLDQHGRPKAFIELVEDASERKRVEMDLAQLAKFPSEHPSPVLRISDDGTILYGNRPSQRLLEAWNCAEGEKLQGFVLEIVGNALRTGQVQQTECPCGDRTLALTIAPVIEAGYVHVYGLDVTDRNQAQLALSEAKCAAETANRAKSEFLANMSHEIRTPMTAILGFSELLLTSAPPPEKQREFLETIRRNGKSLLDLINDILDLSKIEAGKMATERVDCSIEQIIDEMLSMVSMRAQQTNISLEVEYLGPIPDKICTDPGRLRQILVNLAGNAIKFTDQGCVRLTVGLVTGTEGQPILRFTVSDTGIGISPDKLGELFKPFVQAGRFYHASLRWHGIGAGHLQTLGQQSGRGHNGSE